MPKRKRSEETFKHPKKKSKYEDDVKKHKHKHKKHKDDKKKNKEEKHIKKNDDKEKPEKPSRSESSGRDESQSGKKDEVKLPWEGEKEGVKVDFKNFDYDFVPSRVFNSLKCNIIISADKIYFVELKLIDASTKQEVLKDDKCALEGNTAMLINKDSKLKFSIKDCSYNHHNHEFLFELSFYDRTNLTLPVFIMRSRSFLVFARK